MSDSNAPARLFYPHGFSDEFAVRNYLRGDAPPPPPESIEIMPGFLARRKDTDVEYVRKDMAEDADSLFERLGEEWHVYETRRRMLYGQERLWSVVLWCPRPSTKTVHTHIEGRGLTFGKAFINALQNRDLLCQKWGVK